MVMPDSSALGLMSLGFFADVRVEVRADARADDECDDDRRVADCGAEGTC